METNTFGILVGTRAEVVFACDWVDGTDRDTLEMEVWRTSTLERGSVGNRVDVKISLETGLD